MVAVWVEALDPAQEDDPAEVAQEQVLAQEQELQGSQVTPVPHERNNFRPGEAG